MTREEAIEAAIEAGTKHAIEGPIVEVLAEFTRALAEHGYVVAPKEPTEEIVNAIVDAGVDYQGNTLNGPDGYAAHIYRAMISTAGGG